MNSTSPAGDLSAPSANIVSPIQTVYIVHHSHTDFGFTDLPSTTWDLHVDYLRRAVRYAHETASYPEPARFRWTAEVTLVVEKFLQQATSAEIQAFDDLVASGQFEVAGFPHNTTCLMDGPEWDAMVERTAPILKKYQPETIFQNDINGLPWGGIPAWKKSGLRYLWVGVNLHAGGHPEPAPCLWNWEGPDGQTILTYLSFHYNMAYYFTHEKEWRTGPVPHAWDIWHHEPQGERDIYKTDPESLRAAHGLLTARLATMTHYQHPIFGIQATNQWRFDNDPPLRGLSDFVHAWNDARLQPALRLATCRDFMGDFQKQCGDTIPTRRGDWCDWWANGPASMPAELALNQQAKRRLGDAPRAATLLNSQPSSLPHTLRQGWLSATLHDEHTFASYDSIAHPYRASTLGQATQLLEHSYRADEESRLAQAAILRRAPSYCDLSHTRQITVLNPGNTARSGWIELSARALRHPVQAVRDKSTGEIFPIEDILDPEWSRPEAKPGNPYEFPSDAWGFSVGRKRFHLPALAAGASRDFELIEENQPAPSPAALKGNTADFDYEWNATRATFGQLTHRTSRLNFIDPAAPYALGQLVVEYSEAYGARSVLERHTEASRDILVYRTPSILSSRMIPDAYGPRFQTDYAEDQSFHRVEQTWHLLPGGIAELTTTLWLKEYYAPQAFYLAFPFALTAATPAYYSYGHRTRVPDDQLPGSCGEWAMVHDGVEFSRSDARISLATPDNPLGTFDSLPGMNGRRVFPPANAHFYSMLHNNYWTTNFPITKACKLTVRHLIAVDHPDAPTLLPALCGHLWAFPSCDRD